MSIYICSSLYLSSVFSLAFYLSLRLHLSPVFLDTLCIRSSVFTLSSRTDYVKRDSVVIKFLKFFFVSLFAVVKMGCFGSKDKLSKEDMDFLKSHTRYDEATIKEWYKGFKVSEKVTLRIQS